MKFNKTKVNEKISDFICQFLYEQKKFFPYPSLNRYLYYEYYQAVSVEKQKKEETRKEKQRIRTAITNLKNANYIFIDEKQNIKLTEKGLVKAILNISRKYQIKKRKEEYFYLVIFDVPEKYRRIRDLFRRILYNFGAEKVQKSVFILNDKSTYEHIAYLIRISKISDYVRIFIIKRNIK